MFAVVLGVAILWHETNSFLVWKMHFQFDENLQFELMVCQAKQSKVTEIDDGTRNKKMTEGGRERVHVSICEK